MPKPCNTDNGSNTGQARERVDEVLLSERVTEDAPERVDEVLLSERVTEAGNDCGRVNSE